MLIDGRHHRTIWVAEDGAHRAHDRPERCCRTSCVVADLRDARGRRGRDRDHAGARRAADRRHRRLRRGAGHARGRVGRGPGPRLRAPDPHPADRRQPALGARPDAGRAAQPAAASAGSSWPTPRRPRSATRTSRSAAAIGEHGLPLIREIAARKPPGEPVNVLTHCNAGWLATIDWGTATAPIYQAQEAGIPVHVWVDETRPRNQGAALTAFELLHQEVPHTVIADNVGGHLMQHGMVDLCIVGTDRTTRARRRRQQDRHLPEGAGGARQRRAVLCGAARRPRSTGRSRDGVREIPIEQRGADEVTLMRGRTADGRDRDRADHARGQPGRQLGLRRDARPG